MRGNLWLLNMASELLVLAESKESSTRSSPQARRCFNERSLWSTNNQPAFELIAQCYSNQGKYTRPWAHGGNWTQLISTGCPAVSHAYTGQDRARNSCCPQQCRPGTVLECKMITCSLRIQLVTRSCKLRPRWVWGRRCVQVRLSIWLPFWTNSVHFAKKGAWSHHYCLEKGPFNILSRNKTMVPRSLPADKWFPHCK